MFICSVSKKQLSDQDEVVFFPLVKNDNELKDGKNPSFYYQSDSLFSFATAPLFLIMDGEQFNIYEDDNTKIISENYGLDIDSFFNIAAGIGTGQGDPFYCNHPIFQDKIPKFDVYTYKSAYTEDIREAILSMGFVSKKFKTPTLNSVYTYKRDDLYFKLTLKNNTISDMFNTDVISMVSGGLVEYEIEDMNFNKIVKNGKESEYFILKYLIESMIELSGWKFVFEDIETRRTNELLSLSGMFILRSIYEKLSEPLDEYGDYTNVFKNNIEEYTLSEVSKNQLKNILNFNSVSSSHFLSFFKDMKTEELNMIKQNFIYKDIMEDSKLMIINKTLGNSSKKYTRLFYSTYLLLELYVLNNSNDKVLSLLENNKTIVYNMNLYNLMIRPDLDGREGGNKRCDLFKLLQQTTEAPVQSIVIR